MLQEQTRDLRRLAAVMRYESVSYVRRRGQGDIEAMGRMASEAQTWSVTMDATNRDTRLSRLCRASPCKTSAI